MTRREYIRVMQKVDTSGECWLWLGHRMKNRYGEKVYGQVKYRGRTRGVHVVLYEGLVGPIPIGLELDHICKNTACANPKHLEPVTHTENVRRGNAGLFHSTKTHCPSGHEYTVDNIYWDIDRKGRKGRKCRKCVIKRVAEWQLRKRHEQ